MAYRIKVLIVDDNSSITYSLEKGLKSISSQYEVFLANSGKDCLVNVQQHKLDIILLDIIMPDMDGWTVVEKLHTNQDWAHIPIIFITGKADEISQVVGTMSVEDYIVKPIDVKDLDLRIRRILKI